MKIRWTIAKWLAHGVSGWSGSVLVELWRLKREKWNHPFLRVCMLIRHDLRVQSALALVAVLAFYEAMGGDIESLVATMFYLSVSLMYFLMAVLVYASPFIVVGAATVFFLRRRKAP